MKITLLFSASNSIGSHLICWRDWSDYSHVDVVMSNGKLFGAKSSGVEIRNPYPTSRRLILTVEATELQHERFMIAMRNQWGKPYDFAGIIGFAFNRDWEETDKWFCSELIMYAFKQAGINILRTDNVSRISPGDMLLSPLLKE